MEKIKFRVKSNREIALNVFEMILLGDTKGITSPGQFVNIELEGFYLRRPISICDYSSSSLTLIYKVVGKGTKAMSSFQEGKELDILVGLGNGYDLSKASQSVMLIGGGVGVPPLYNLAKKLIALGKSVHMIMGFNSKNEVFYEKEFLSLGCKVSVTTVDGSYGIKGFVTDALDKEAGYFYTCGPEPMLKAVYSATSISGEFSFEERMGCGFGSCMGCSCKTLYGNKRICKDGPVLKKEEIIWEK